MTRFDTGLPTLALVLRHVAQQIDVPEEDIIAGGREGSDEGRDLFCWLALHVTVASVEAVAFTVCLDPDDVERRRDAVDLRRLSDRPYRERLAEVALEIHVEASLVKRKLLAGAPDRDAAVTARRILSGQRQLLTIPVADMVHLAASYEALVRRIGELDRATKALLVATYTPAEKTARSDQVRAMRSLVACIPSKSQEQHHG